jgi:Penicillin amidase
MIGAPQVEILYDRGGVPHVRADSQLDVYFGQGYATAADRLSPRWPPRSRPETSGFSTESAAARSARSVLLRTVSLRHPRLPPPVRNGG